jgi:hypothetical protein
LQLWLFNIIGVIARVINIYMAYYKNPKFLFGKYRGRAVANVPRDYLEWYVASTDTPDFAYQAFRTAVINQLAAWDKLRGKKYHK